MSIKQMSLVWEHDFAPNEQLIMLALADHANDEGGSIYPSYARIAWKTGYSKRNVQRIVKDLVGKKILQLVKDFNPYGRPNEYRIRWEYAKKKPPYMGGRQNVTPSTEGGIDTTVDTLSTPVSTEPSVNHHLTTLEELFSTTTHIPIPDDWKIRQKRWRTPLKRMDKMCNGDTPKLIEAAIKEMRANKLTISAPQSIEKVFIDLYSKSKTKQERRLPNAADLP